MQKLLDWILCSIAAFAIVMALFYMPPARAGSLNPQQAYCIQIAAFAIGVVDERETVAKADKRGKLQLDAMPRVVRDKVLTVLDFGYAWEGTAEKFQQLVFAACAQGQWRIRDDPESEVRFTPAKGQRFSCANDRDLVLRIARDVVEQEFKPEQFGWPSQQLIAEHVLACRKDPDHRDGKALEDCVMRKCMGSEA